ncbi:unnamed protein product [Allacma fusca]|uniref:Uncharacterized protein n=1 Tax=Allacma fusca TaxID=39272 RepID=A0A8J2PL61_9HEXA|nr:unnamed protein product [Allacma fusca]
MELTLNPKWGKLLESTVNLLIYSLTLLHYATMIYRKSFAERRILGQAAKTGDQKPIIIRCFDCATDNNGNFRFAYNHNVFGTTNCLAVQLKKFSTPLSL